MITFLIEDWLEKLHQNFMVRAVLIDPSKAFDCIPHDLLIEKLAAHVMFCAIWYHLCNLKNVKNTHERVLLLAKLQAFSLQLY